MTKPKSLTQTEVVSLIRAATVISSQKHVASNLGVTPAFLCDVLKGRRDISAEFAKTVGYERQVIFVELPAKETDGK